MDSRTFVVRQFLRRGISPVKTRVLAGFFLVMMRCVLMMIFCCFSTGCDRIYRVLDQEGAQEREIIGKILPYESNAKILEAQTFLKLYGYAIGRPDGVLGGRTRDIIEKFQKDAGLKPSRFLDQVTWNKLHEFEEIGLIHNQRLHVQQIQIFLQRAQCYSGRADGLMGAKTFEAIKQFQVEHKLVADGKIGYRTLEALAKYQLEVR